MIIIINGPPGIGKREVSKELIELFDNAFMVDVNQMMFVESFGNADINEYKGIFNEIYNKVKSCRLDGYAEIIICYEFNGPEKLSVLKKLLSDLDDVIYSFCLEAGIKEIRNRLLSGKASCLEKTIEHAERFMEILEKDEKPGDWGYPVDCEGLSARETARAIAENIREEVRIAEYSSSWPELFITEKLAILKGMRPLIKEIYHIGSTAVPGLPAKPVIDIMIEILKLEDAVYCYKPLRKIGYVYVEYPQNTDRRFFRKGLPRTHHIHIVESGSESLKDHIDFRDALRKNEALKEHYRNMKLELSGRYRDDRASYSAAKTAFIIKALAEYRHTF